MQSRMVQAIVVVTCLLMATTAGGQVQVPLVIVRVLEDYDQPYACGYVRVRGDISVEILSPSQLGGERLQLRLICPGTVRRNQCFRFRVQERRLRSAIAGSRLLAIHRPLSRDPHQSCE